VYLSASHVSDDEEGSGISVVVGFDLDHVSIGEFDWLGCNESHRRRRRSGLSDFRFMGG